MLNLYRAGLELRRKAMGRRAQPLRWLPERETVLAFARGEGFACLVNFGHDPLELPAGADVLISSDELEGGVLPKDTTVWLRLAGDKAPPAGA